MENPTGSVVDTGGGGGAPPSVSSPSVVAPAAPATPTTAAPASAPGDSSFDLNAAINALDGPTPAVPAADPKAAAPAPGAPAKVVDKAAAPTDVVDPLADDVTTEEELTPDSVSADGKVWVVKAARAEKWKQARALQHELENAIPGFNLDMAKGLHTKALGVDELLEDYHSGTPEATDKVLGFFGAQNPDSLGMMAMRLPGILAQSNPEALTALREGMFEQSLDALYPEAVAAAKAGNQNFINALQVIEHHLTGKFRSAKDFENTDPLATERADLTRRENALRTESQQRQEGTLRSYGQGLSASVRDTLTAEILSGLEPVKEGFKDRPQDWKHLQRDLDEAIGAKIQSNPAFERENDVTRRGIVSAIRRGDQGTAEQLKATLLNRYKTLAGQVVKANRKSLIQAVTTRVVAGNQAVHDKHQAAQTQREVPSAGVPSQSNGIPKGGKATNLTDLWKELNL